MSDPQYKCHITKKCIRENRHEFVHRNRIETTGKKANTYECVYGLKSCARLCLIRTLKSGFTSLAEMQPLTCEHESAHMYDSSKVFILQ